MTTPDVVKDVEKLDHLSIANGDLKQRTLENNLIVSYKTVCAITVFIKV